MTAISPNQMMNFIGRMLVREGGDQYTNDPRDRGGPTKYGVTLAALQEWRGTPVTAADVERLTLDEAVRLYMGRYVPPYLSEVSDEGCREQLFDIGVNSGTGGAAMMLQRVLAANGDYKGKIDGDIGPASVAALQLIKNWPAMFFAIKAERLEAYLRIIGANPSQVVYAAGWANRADMFQQDLTP